MVFNIYIYKRTTELEIISVYFFTLQTVVAVLAMALMGKEYETKRKWNRKERIKTLGNENGNGIPKRNFRN